MSEYELPLVFFTVLSQWAVGTVIALTVLFSCFPEKLDDAVLKKLPTLSIAVFVINAFATALSLLHLGSPFQAYNAILGIAHSWLSREIVAYIVLNLALLAWVFVIITQRRNLALLKTISLLVSLVGVLAILTSAQVYYQASSHPLWHTPLTHTGFIATALLLGFLTVSLWSGLVRQGVLRTPASLLLGVLCGVILTVVTLYGYSSGLQQQGELLASAKTILSSGLFGWQIAAGIITALLAALYLMKAPRLSGGASCAVMLLVLSSALGGRMLFYSGVMQQAPWF